jgi:hypothetical protein
MSNDFHGLPVRRLSNGRIGLDVLEGAGPRVVRLWASGGENLFVEMPERSWETPAGRYSIRGGHRLWHAPEAFPRTYQPDNEGLQIDEVAGGLRLAQPAEPATGIAKTMTITLEPDAPRAVVRHELYNAGVWPVELAPWAISQLRPGGTAILPLGAPEPQRGPLPDRHLVLWPYTRWGDPRIALDDDYLLAEARVGMPPSKLGCFGRMGWCAYLLRDTLLVKRFAARPGLPHADRGCNMEVYFDQYNLELETLGPLVRLEPGEAVEHSERWELHSGVRAEPGMAGVRRLVAELELDNNALQE